MKCSFSSNSNLKGIFMKKTAEGNTRRQCRWARFADYFTLIELLIVISIIAVLAGMLLPALNKARETARTIVCASQFSDMGKAVIMYLNDNNDVIPVYWQAGRNPYLPPEDPYKRNIFGTGDKGTLAPYLGLTQETRDIGVILKDGRRGPLVCPAKKHSADYTSYTYGMNDHIYPSTVTAPIHITSLKHVSRSMFFGEPDFMAGPLLKLYTTDANRIGYPHTGQANVLFLDSHVEKRSKNQIPDQSNYAIAGNRYFWIVTGNGY